MRDVIDTHHHRGWRCQSNRISQGIGHGDHDGYSIDDDDEGNTVDAIDSWEPGKEYVEARIKIGEEKRDGPRPAS